MTDAGQGDDADVGQGDDADGPEASGAAEGERGAGLTDRQARQVAAVVDVCLERGFDVEDVDRSVLEAARDRLRDRS